MISVEKNLEYNVYHYKEYFYILTNYNAQNFRLMTGYKLVTGQYPYGRDTRLLPYIPMLESWMPIIALQWAK